MAAHPNSDAPGWLTSFRRGVLAGLSIPVLGLVVVAIPVLVAWIVPGSDSVSAASAVRASSVALLSGLRGGVVLNGSMTTLAPLSVTVLLGWLIYGPARRFDSVASVVGLCAGVPIACLALARWLPLGSTYAPPGRTALAGTVLVVIVASAARCAPGLWQRCSDRGHAIVRATGGAILGYAAVSSLLVALALGVHLHSAVGMQSRVAPGAGGLGVLLLGIGAVPNALVLSAGYLTGAGFSVGAGTTSSVLSTRSGQTPDFPLLAAVPAPGGLCIPAAVIAVLTAVAVGWLILAVLEPQGRGRRVALDVAVVALAFGASLGLLALVAEGGIAGSSVPSVGVSGWRLAIFSSAAVLAGSVVAAAGRALVARLTPAVIATPASAHSTPASAHPTPASAHSTPASAHSTPAQPVVSEVPPDDPAEQAPSPRPVPIKPADADESAVQALDETG